MNRTHSVLDKYKVHEFSVGEKDEKVTYKYPYGARASKFNPTNDALRAQARRALESDIKQKRTLLGDAVSEWSKEDCEGGTQLDWHDVIWTVPYCFESQPIEQLWAYVKNFVSWAWTGSRGVAQLRSDILAGFYGDGKAHKGVSAELCQKFIARAHAHLNGWISSWGPNWGGTIDKLRSTAPIQSFIVNLGDDDDEEEVDDTPLHAVAPSDSPAPPPAHTAASVSSSSSASSSAAK
jgi:hypothetical protein